MSDEDHNRDIYDDLPGEHPIPKPVDEYLILAPYPRDLECEHRDVLEDRSLDPCHQTAQWVTIRPFGSGDTRTKYCDEHIDARPESWLEMMRDDRIFGGGSDE